jgi:tetratricopeptide (TPR) repeat protein
MAQARLLWSEGKLPEAIDAATKVANTMEAAKKADEDISYQTITSMLEVMLDQDGRPREALEWSRRAIAALQRSGREATISMANARHNEASHLYAGGEVRAAFDLQRSIVEKLSAQQGMESLPAPFVGRLGQYEVRVEETDAGLTWLDRAVSMADAQSHRPSQIGALLNRARANVRLGRLDAVLADVAAAEKLAQNDPHENLDAFRVMRLVRAHLLIARANPEAAIGELDAGLAESGYPGRRTGARLADMLTLKANAEVALGRNSSALATAREALATAEARAIQPEHSADVGAALMALAQAQRAMGDIEGARASASRAAVALTAGLGPNHSETRAALGFR